MDDTEVWKMDPYDLRLCGNRGCELGRNERGSFCTDCRQLRRK